MATAKPPQKELKTPIERNYTCADCGEIHQAAPKGPIPSLCPECRHLAKIQYDRELRATTRTLPARRECKYCHSEFKPMYERMIYCSKACRLDAMHDKAYGEKLQPVQCWQCNALIQPSTNAATTNRSGDVFCTYNCMKEWFDTQKPKCQWPDCEILIMPPQQYEQLQGMGKQIRHTTLRKPDKFCSAIHRHYDYCRRAGLPLDTPLPRHLVRQEQRRKATEVFANSQKGKIQKHLADYERKIAFKPASRATAVTVMRYVLTDRSLLDISQCPALFMYLHRYPEQRISFDHRNWLIPNSELWQFCVDNFTGHPDWPPESYLQEYVEKFNT